MAEYKVMIDEREIIEFDSIRKSIDCCKKNNKNKKYVVMCPELQYTLVGTRISPSQIDWVNSEVSKDNPLSIWPKV